MARRGERQVSAESLIGKEKECFVLDNGSAQCSAKVVLPVRKILIVIEPLRIQLRVPEEIVGYAMKFVCSRLQRKAGDGAAGPAIRRRKAVRLDGEFAKGVHGRRALVKIAWRPGPAGAPAIQ